MYQWISYAFVRIVIFYVAGVLFGILVPAQMPLWFCLSLCVILATIFVICTAWGKGKSLVAGAVAALALCLAGILNVGLTDESRHENHLIHLKENVTAYHARVETSGQERPRTWKYEVVIDQVLVKGVWRPAFSRALMYIRKDSALQRYHYGDVLSVRAKPQRIQGPKNPGEFDLEKFQRYRQVYFQATVSPEQIKLTAHEPSNRIAETAITARLWADGVLARYVRGEREYAIASAFVLGITDGLDNELMNAYAATGAMHVLSVSGLHVGIVYWLLLLIFKPLGTERGRWLLLIVSLIVLWSYAFVTGISSSVLRAVVMFSFAAIARAWNHKTNIYNILAATACVLLIIDPFMIMSIGFQLSYIAVLGIVGLQPVLYRLWEPTWWLWDEIWKVCAVSIAAQVATLPFCLYYFHQFPNYFLFTNLFIVPGSFVVLILGIFLLATSVAEPIAHLIGWFLRILIDVLNALIFAVENLPWSVIKNIFITPIQCGLLLGLVAIGWFWVERRGKIALAIGLVVATMLPIASWIHTIKATRPSVIVYSVAGSTAVDLIENNVTSYLDLPILAADLRQRTPNRIGRRAAGRSEPLLGVPLQEGCDLYVWKGISIIRVHRPIQDFTSRCTADLVLISNNAVEDMDRLARTISATYYVLDGTNNRMSAAKLTNQVKAFPVRLHNVLQEGALELRI